MAFRYRAGKEHFGKGKCNFLTDDIRVIALDASYVASDADGFVLAFAGLPSDPANGTKGWRSLSADPDGPVTIDTPIATPAEANAPATEWASVVGMSPLFTGKTIVDGLANANDPLFVGLPGGRTITQLVVAKFAGVGVLPGGFTDGYYVPFANITHDTTDTPISFPTGSGVDLIVRWENVAPLIFEV